MDRAKIEAAIRSIDKELSLITNKRDIDILKEQRKELEEKLKQLSNTNTNKKEKSGFFSWFGGFFSQTNEDKKKEDTRKKTGFFSRVRKNIKTFGRILSKNFKEAFGNTESQNNTANTTNNVASNATAPVTDTPVRTDNDIKNVVSEFIKKVDELNLDNIEEFLSSLNLMRESINANLDQLDEEAINNYQVAVKKLGLITRISKYISEVRALNLDSFSNKKTVDSLKKLSVVIENNLENVSEDVKDKYIVARKKFDVLDSLFNFVNKIREINVNNQSEFTSNLDSVLLEQNMRIIEENISLLSEEEKAKYVEAKKKFEDIKKKKERNVVNNNSVNNLELSKLMNEVLGFELKPTLESIRECENLISRVFKLNTNERKIIHDNREVWSKVRLLMKQSKEYCEKFKHLDKKNDLLQTFIDIVSKFQFGETVSFDKNQLDVCIGIYSRLSADERKQIPSNILQIYNDALIFGGVHTLETKLPLLDIDECLRKRQYSEILECCDIYDRFNRTGKKGLAPQVGNDLEHKRKLGRVEIASLPKQVQEKLERVLKIREDIYSNASVVFDYRLANVAGKICSVTDVTIQNGDEVLGELMIPLASNSTDINLIIRKVTEKFPLITEEQVKEGYENSNTENLANTRGSRR